MKRALLLAWLCSVAPADAGVPARTAAPDAAPSRSLLRAIVADTALSQARRMDPAWHPAQRDCAGLVRFAFRTAYRRLKPAQVDAGLWRGAGGERLDFADAQTLLAYNFEPLGRDGRLRESLQSGDLLAFRQESPGGPLFHLMLVVVPADRAHARARVVYHPGQKGAEVRLGTLDSLSTDAPVEWRPTPENGAFLGYFRFKEWSP